MTNHSRINLVQLSWVVIILAVGVLAVGTMTKAFADSPVVTGFNNFSGQFSIEPVATLGDPFVSEFGVQPLQSGDSTSEQTTFQIEILPVDPDSSLPETTGLPSDSPPIQMIMHPPDSFTPLPSGEIDVSQLPAPEPEPVPAPEDSIETAPVIDSGPLLQGLGEDASIPIQVVEFQFLTEVQELPQNGPVVVVELEPVDVLHGDTLELDASQGLQMEPEEPAVETSAPETNVVSIETVEVIQPGAPSQDSGEEPSIPIQVVEFQPLTGVHELPQEDPVVVVELEPVDVLQRDTPELDVSQGLQLEPEEPAGGTSAQDGSDAPIVPEQPSADEPGSGTPIKPEQPAPDDSAPDGGDAPAGSEKPAALVQSEMVELGLSSNGPNDPEPPVVANDPDPDPDRPEDGDQDDPQEAKKREIENRLKGHYKLGGNKGSVTAERKEGRHVVEKYEYLIDKAGNVTKETHWAQPRDPKGNFKTRKIETVERSGGKTVTTIEELELSSLGAIKGGTRRVVTKETGKETVVQILERGKGRRWVDVQEAETNRIAAAYKQHSYEVKIDKGLVTATKSTKDGKLVKHDYEINNAGIITKETHRTDIRNAEGILTGSNVRSVDRSGGKSVATIEKRSLGPKGETTGGTKRVWTKEPGKESKVEMYDWKRGKGWVKRPDPGLGALPGAPKPKTVKQALVIDTGDESSWRGDAGTLADNMAEDADGMTVVLKDKGYDVGRLSQYWGNSHGRFTKNLLKGAIEGYAETLGAGDELFIYISSHGDSGGFVIFDSSGSGAYSWVQYGELDAWLDKIDSDVKTIMLDACECGGGVRHLSGPNRTIITATDGKTNAAGGQGLTDSFTEDFLEAFEDVSNADKNKKDGVDWKETFDYAREQGEDYNPQFVTPLKDKQDEAQKAKRKAIADRLRDDGYRVATGYSGGKGTVTARKYDKRGNLVEEHKYEIDKGGKVSKETHRTEIRDPKGNLKGRDTTTVERLPGGKTVTTTEKLDTSTLGSTKGGTKRVVTTEPGKEAEVEMYDWRRGTGWVKRWPKPDLGALPVERPDLAEGRKELQTEPKGDGPDRPDVPSVDPRQLPEDESKDENQSPDEGCKSDGAKPCPLGCDAVPVKGLCGQYYLWWTKHHQHEWAVHSGHFECAPDLGEIDLKIGCLWPDPAEFQEGSTIPTDESEEPEEPAIDEPDLPTAGQTAIGLTKNGVAVFDMTEALRTGNAGPATTIIEGVQGAAYLVDTFDHPSRAASDAQLGKYGTTLQAANFTGTVLFGNDSDRAEMLQRCESGQAGILPQFGAATGEYLTNRYYDFLDWWSRD